jgi:hypothetical protein
VADRGYLPRLLRRFNEMREWHHVNLRSTGNSKTIPGNELKTEPGCESVIRFEGSEEDVAEIARGLPGSSTTPAGWLEKQNWWRMFPVLTEPGFKWVTSNEGLGLQRIMDDSHLLPEDDHTQYASVDSNFPNNPVSFLDTEPNYEEEEAFCDEENEDGENEEDGKEDVDGEEVDGDDISNWLDY